MEELVLVPLWRRPGFAEACLRRLAVAADSNLYFRFLLDEGHDPEIHDVIARFAKNLSPLNGHDVVERKRRVMRGNSHNILTALKHAATGPWEMVHLIEEDVFVSAGYFDFHRRAHDLAPHAFAVSACKNQNLITLPPLGYTDAVYAHPSYQSLGVSLRPEVVRSVVPHVTAAYFEDPVGYCRRTFPNSKIPAPHAEQDGLLNRLREKAGRSTVYPHVPRAYHAGFEGYNRQAVDHLLGPAEEQADRLLAMTGAELNAMASPKFRDHQTSDLDLNVPVTRILG